MITNCGSVVALCFAATEHVKTCLGGGYIIVRQTETYWKYAPDTLAPTGLNGYFLLLFFWPNSHGIF